MHDNSAREFLCISKVSPRFLFPRPPLLMPPAYMHAPGSTQRTARLAFLRTLPPSCTPSFAPRHLVLPTGRGHWLAQRVHGPSPREGRDVSNRATTLTHGGGIRSGHNRGAGVCRQELLLPVRLRPCDPPSLESLFVHVVVVVASFVVSTACLLCTGSRCKYQIAAHSTAVLVVTTSTQVLYFWMRCA